MVLADGGAARRMLWYACQGADLVHAVEVGALLQSEEVCALRSAYTRLAGQARTAGFHSVASVFEKRVYDDAPRAGWLEILFSALWRLEQPVLSLFSAPVQEAVCNSRAPQPLG